MISELIYGFLAEEQAITDIVGDRIFPDEITQAETGKPYLIYRISGNVPTNDHDGPSELDWRMLDVFCYAKTRKQCDDLASAVRGAIDGKSSGKIYYTWYVDDHSDFLKDANLYTNSAEYKLQLNRLG